MFGLEWMEIAMLAGMLACLVPLKLCGGKRRGSRYALPVAVLSFCGIVLLAGAFFWNRFAGEAAASPAATVKERANVQWRAQGYGIARWLEKNDPGNKAILVIWEENEANKTKLEEFKRGLAEAGVDPARTDFRPLTVSAADGIPAGYGGSLVSLMTPRDLHEIMKAYGENKTVVSLVGVPPTPGRNGGGERNWDFTNRGGRLFLVGGNVYENPVQLEMTANGWISALIQPRPDAPGFEDAYPAGAPEAFEAFYRVVVPENARQAYREYRDKRDKRGK